MRTPIVSIASRCLILLGLLVGGGSAAYGQETPGGVHGVLSIDIDCSACHRTDAWKPLRAALDFDHNRQTRFPLTGSHARSTCAACHLDLRFDAPKVEANDCAACHVDVHQEAFAGGCVDCHNTTAFAEVEGLEIHNRTRFPLTGAHAQISCESCHPSDQDGAFALRDTECLACHEPDYDAAHGADDFPTTCEACHNTLAWAATPPFDHATASAGFALLGAHEQAPCSACHQEPGFQPLFRPSSQEDCLTCHQPDYDQQHAGTGFPTECLACHTVEGWSGAVFDHGSVANGFALLDAHQALDCAACHAPPPGLEPLFAPVDETDCITCHQPDFQSAHAGSGFPTTCQTCHDAQDWQNATFEHATAAGGFALLGAHEQLPCAACHNPPPGFEPLFTPVDQEDCLTCHQPDYDREHAGSGFSTDCQVCHGVDSWEGAVFDHGSVANGFALLGAHEVLDCAACHAPPPGFEPLFTPSGQEDCLTCHQPDYDQQHAGTGFPTECLACHTVEGWEGVVFDHGSVANGFDLAGAHQALDCAACHAPPPGFEPLFTPVDEADCQTCHQPDYEQAHAGSGFPTTCQTCHDAEDWQNAAFEHATATNGFALLGAHEALPCAACHNPPPGFEPLFTPVDQEDCLTCHQSDYDRQHAGTGFPTQCQACHSVDSWDETTFDHGLVANGFALLGAHEVLDCAACHAPPPGFEPLFAPSGQEDCVTCHQPDYDREHAGSGFPTACLGCHTVEDWDDAAIDHDVLSRGFALIGAHEALDCSACHAPPPGFEPLFPANDENDCVVCHEPDFQSAHAGSGFPTTCQTCHDAEDWQNASFEHATAANGFALLGAHEALPCLACHNPPPDFTPIFTPADDNDCITCHQPDYDQQHAGTGFPTECLACHTVEDWGDVNFDHAGVANGFRLLGAHQTLDCLACHNPPPDFTPIFTPTDDNDCITCHQPDYDQQHAADGFPFECQVCHTVDTWTGAVFEHSASSGGYPLVGAHETLPCSACHLPPPDFTPIFTPVDADDCFTCHESDYQQEHGGSGYPTTCLICHNNTSWPDADFDHDGDYFPIFSGKHRDEWPSCATCHIDPSDFQVFTCLDCHEHNQPDTDDDHSEVPGYVYESNACYACHPTGEN